MIMKQFRAMVKARTMEFVRDRGTFFWNLLFPILMVAGFSIVFSGDGDKVFRVGIIGEPPGGNTAVSGLPPALDSPDLEISHFPDTEEDREEALGLLRRHQLELVLEPARRSYWINSESPQSRVAALLLAVPDLAPGANDASLALEPALSEASGPYRQEQVMGRPIRYVDWVIPGVIGMNMMFSCLFGVGFVIVRYRKNGVLKRMKATPVNALNFVAAQVASRLLIVLSTTVFIFVATNLFLDFTMEGSYLDLLLFTVLEIICLISLGLVFASRLRSEELTNGLMDLIMFPMILVSGVFFSLDAAPQILQEAVRFLPLPPFINAARQIMLEGAGLASLMPELLTLTGLSVLFMVVAARLFKWE